MGPTHVRQSRRRGFDTHRQWHLSLGALCLAALTGCAGSPTPPSSPGSDDSPSDSTSSTSVAAPYTKTDALADPESLDTCSATLAVRTLSARDKVAQLLTVGVASPDDASGVLRQHRVGGIFVGTSSVESILGARVIPTLVGDSELPVTVAIDQEGGRVDRLSALYPPAPSPRVMAATMSPDEVTELARLTGERLKELGVTVDFAPSIDVSPQPDGAVIGDRSFSLDANVVTQYGKAFATGLNQSGITAVFKHFPGHGQSTGDSHHERVWIPPLNESDDLVPFRELVGKPGSAIMVGHMHVPGINESLPASLSPAIYRALRSGEFGTTPYDGVIYTDDLSGMRAVTDRYPLPEAVVEALKAGADVPLFISTAEVSAVLDRVTAAVASGEYPADKLNASLMRVLRSRGCTL